MTTIQDQLETLTPETLNILCFDHFPSVYKKFKPGMSKQQKVRSLVIHCQGRGEIDTLLSLAQLEKPAETSVPRLTETPVPQQPSSVQPTQPMLQPTSASAPSSRPPSPRFMQIKLKALEDRYDMLVKQYEAANQQFNHALAATDKVTLQQQMRVLEQEMQDVDDQINQLKGLPN